VFPHDYRSGPGKTDWDPSKWVIFTLAKFGVAWGLRRAIPEDIAEARARMLTHERHEHHIDAHESRGEKEEWTGPTWTEAELKAYVERNSACVMLIDGYVVDVTGYIKTHVRSPFVLRSLISFLIAWDLLADGGGAYSLEVRGCCVSTLSQLGWMRGVTNGRRRDGHSMGA
jgi:hypothetical protein